MANKHMARQKIKIEARKQLDITQINKTFYFRVTEAPKCPKTIERSTKHEMWSRQNDNKIIIYYIA